MDKDDGELSKVEWTLEAAQAVADARARGALLPLYPPLKPPKSRGGAKKGAAGSEGGEVSDAAAAAGPPGAGCEVCHAISEVVAQDPRALNDGRGRATLGEAYAMTFSSLRVAFEVRKGGPGAGGAAVVVAADDDPGDPTAPLGIYQHSMSLRRAAERRAASEGRRLPVPWATPVREGKVTGLFDLRGGGTWGAPPEEERGLQDFTANATLRGK